jgi:hypothetical protein
LSKTPPPLKYRDKGLGISEKQKRREKSCEFEKMGKKRGGNLLGGCKITTKSE